MDQWDALAWMGIAASATLWGAMLLAAATRWQRVAERLLWLGTALTMAFIVALVVTRP
jgi:hypothetical protein